MTSVLSFFDFSKEETQKAKNEIRLPFYRFSVYVPKTEERKKTSVLPFFLLCTRKHKNGKTTIGFRFIVFQFAQANGSICNKREQLKENI